MAASAERIPFAAIVLAAGQGKRMQSDLPKVLHPLRGKPLVNWVIEAARGAGAERVVAVLGYGREQVEKILPAGAETALQLEQKGTGHAARCAEERLGGYAGPVVVLSGDVPLIRAATIRELVARQRASGAAAVVLSAQVGGEHAYGRIVRDSAGAFKRIVEHKDATPDERKIGEINTGTYAFGPGRLFEALKHLKDDNAQGEFYLTDTVGWFARRGEGVEAIVAPRVEECLGINTPQELAAAERASAALSGKEG